MSSFFFFYVNPLSSMWFTDIFSYLIGCLLILLMVPFDEQKHFSLMLSHLFVFTFVVFVFGES